MTSTTKRGPGRPRKSPAPTGASLRDAARHFGVSRRVILRWIDEGMPSSLHNERRYIDLEKAQAWCDVREDHEPQIPAAKVYHPSDPRYRLSVASGNVRTLTMQLESGQRISFDAINTRIVEELTALNNGLKALLAMIPNPTELSPAKAEEVLTPAIEHILEDFRLESGWPQTDALIANEMADAGSEFETYVEYVPVLPSSDPRAREATLKADSAQTKLAMLESSTVATEDLRGIVANIAISVRHHVRQIPGAVAATLKEADDYDTIRDVIESKSDVARIMISGPAVADEKIAEALAVVCDGRPFPSVIQLVQDATIRADAPAGAEFDIPDRSEDIAAVLAVLASYPDASTGPVSEFG